MVCVGREPNPGSVHPTARIGSWGSKRQHGSMRGLFKRVSRVFGGKQQHEAEVLNLRGVVVANSIDDVYKVNKRLGEGQTAVVLLGERYADGKQYALKCFKLNEGTRAAVEGLRDEVNVLRALPKHSHLCTMLEIISCPGHVYLAMELVAGGDLLSPIEERGAYSEKAAQSLFAQMVDGVDTMHQSGIVHRDLKPENVCFTDSSRRKLKIIDMGAAGFLTEEGLSDLCGTPLYAAPEVTPWYFNEGRGGPPPPRYDERVDLWSMGVALYVMLSGSAPFNQDQDVDGLLRDVCKGKLGAPRANCRRPIFFQFLAMHPSVSLSHPAPLSLSACRHELARLAADLLRREGRRPRPLRSQPRPAYGNGGAALPPLADRPAEGD